MTDRSKPPRQELIIPPHANAHAVARLPTGLLDTWTSGFMARRRSDAVKWNNELHERLRDSIDLHTQINEALKRNFISRADLDDIDNIIEERLRANAMTRLMARIDDDAALQAKLSAIDHDTEHARAHGIQLRTAIVEAQQKLFEAQQALLRKQEAAGSLDEQERRRNRTAELNSQKEEEDARARLITAERDRRIAEAIRDIVINIATLKTQTSEADQLRDYLKMVAALPKSEQSVSRATQTTALGEAMAHFQNLHQKALRTKDTTEVGIWGRVLSELQRIGRMEPPE